jgi:Fur family transcriptional regulator, ferric uptake regulator
VDTSGTRASPMDRFREYLVARGLKYTRQRQAIAEVLFASASHLSLDELLAQARAVQPSVGYATVYRTMKLLAESGIASEHKFADIGHARYELAVEGEHHDHLICVTCGRILEYEDDEIERRQEEMASARGFRVVSHRHEIYGECLRNPCPDRMEPPEPVTPR